MNLKLSFIENSIELSDEYIRCVEIENKKYFYRIVDILNNYARGIILEDSMFNEEVKIKVYIDYFNLDFNNRKIINNVYKLINLSASEDNQESLRNTYKKLIKQYHNILENIDIPLVINQELNLDELSKNLNIEIKIDDLVKNIFTIIDICKEIKDVDIIFFVNLKDYLNNEELNEIYKYAIYNKIVIAMIDSKSFGICQKYEKKFIIDNNLDEYML